MDVIPCSVEIHVLNKHRPTVEGIISQHEIMLSRHIEGQDSCFYAFNSSLSKWDKFKHAFYSFFDSTPNNEFDFIRFSDSLGDVEAAGLLH